MSDFNDLRFDFSEQDLRICEMPSVNVDFDMTNYLNSLEGVGHQSLLSMDNSSDDNLSLGSSSHSQTFSEEHYSDSTGIRMRTTHNSDSDSTKRVKRERNKVSASKYRQKKKEYVNGLEEEVSHLQHELADKCNRVSQLETENRMLKEQLSFMQKLFAIATNNPGASAFALSVVILFAFVIPFGFLGTANYATPPIPAGAHNRRILQNTPIEEVNCLGGFPAYTWDYCNSTCTFNELQ